MCQCYYNAMVYVLQIPSRVREIGQLGIPSLATLIFPGKSNCPESILQGKLWALANNSLSGSQLAAILKTTYDHLACKPSYLTNEYQSHTTNPLFLIATHLQCVHALF